MSTSKSKDVNFGPTAIFSDTCDTVDGGVGSCILLVECELYKNMLKDDPKSATILLNKARCGFQGDRSLVCCPGPGLSTYTVTSISSITNTTVPTSTPTAAPPVMPTTASPSSPTPSTLDSEVFYEDLPEPPVCGVSNATLPRVVGGVNAKLGALPWMALLGYMRGSDTEWKCGGSLISAHYVMTAAHCVHNLGSLHLVRLGELDLARDDETSPVDVIIKSKIQHSDYNPLTYANDIALLLLNNSVTFTALIRPICIPRRVDLRSETFEKRNPFVAGWGRTAYMGKQATHLQVLQLPVVSNTVCAKIYANYTRYAIDQRVICAGYVIGGRDSCQGDSGGPLLLPIRNSTTQEIYFYQIGVVSYGKECAKRGFSGVYTRVTHYVPWIEEKVMGKTGGK